MAEGSEGDLVSLVVSSATSVMVVGVGRGRAVLSQAVVTAERRHAEEIAPAVVAVLAEAGLALPEVERMVVDVGPGLFTGLRVGLATVRSLAFALDRPVVGVTSLAALAATRPEVGAVTAVVDARRNEVFQQVFVDGAPSADAVVGPADGLAGEAKGLVIGDGADRHPDPYRSAGLELATGVHATVDSLLAAAANIEAVPGHRIAPFYLRDPDVNPNVKVRPHG